ncbi:GAF domain-containing sensor histidine kinase [Candidatus Daviesbacteria bacterium]|nr:GAF domain-containing sensor histidine kinase [Candidatus Daviesbacteria bacterium]
MTNTAKDQNYLRLISEASKILSSQLELAPSLNKISQFIVLNLADCCAIDLIDENKNIQLTSSASKDPKQVKIVPKSHFFQVSRVLKTGQAKFVPRMIIVPLVTKGETIGALTLINSSRSRQFSRHDLTTAEELAVRIALDVTNARIYHHLEQAIKARDKFISIASHELKTPLTTLKSFSQILLRRFPDKGELVSYLSKMENQLDRLNSLVASLLDVSCIQSGKLELQKEKFDLQNLLLEQIEDLQAISPLHKIVLEKAIAAPVFADKYRLSQVLTNLISNAIKYSPKADKIIVSLTGGRNFITVAIQDFGIGIAQKNFKKIFEPFYQVNNTIRKSFSGLGLGLHICHEIIQRHQGEIWVKSIKGEGSVFSFKLPRAYFKRSMRARVPPFESLARLR